VAVPVSLISTFAVMYLCDYSLDNLSLMALTIATGFVVDDAIVVLENTARHLEAGMAPRDAAKRGAKEISFTVLSMSLSLVAVFIPILLMGGMLGRLFREFAVTLSAAILVSMVLSLTTTPMMCALLLRRHEPHQPGRLFALSERVFDWMTGVYEKSLSWALRHSFLMLLLTLATLAVNILLFSFVPRGFFPQQDTGRLSGMIRADQNISFQAMLEKTKAITQIITKDPAVDSVVAIIGGGGGGASVTRNTGRMFISLKPLEDRVGATDVIARLRKPLSEIAGAPTFLQAVQDLNVGGTLAAAQFQYALRSDDLDALNVWAPKMEERLRRIPLLADVSSDQQVKGLQSLLQIDRDSASRLGITPRLLDDTLYDAFGQRQVSIIYTLLNQYHVVMEVAPDFWQNPDGLKEIFVVLPTGATVPLSSVVRTTTSATTLAVNHRTQSASVTLSFNLPAEVALGDAVTAIEQAARDLGLPGSIMSSFSGTAQAFQESLANEPMLILAALIAVYVMLGILYESYVHPITILSTLPSAGVGALLALMVTRIELSIVALIGIILLIGIVKKNGIMMVDFALDAERREGKSPREAIYQACLLRFRPIMMTTTAALLGALPLALGRGMGAEIRRPLGTAIVGGLIVSQMLTLYTTPVIYLYLDRLRHWVNRRRGHEAPHPTA
jgi:multidrug efflux pump